MTRSAKKLSTRGDTQEATNTTIYFDYVSEKRLTEFSYEIRIAEVRYGIALSKFKKKLGATVACKLCEFEGEWPDAIFHRREHEYDSMKDPPIDMYTRFLTNAIVKKIWKYHCHLCSQDFPNWIKTLKHIDSSSHQEKKAENYLCNPSMKRGSLEEYNYMRMVLGSIYIGNDGYFICDICKSHLLGVPSCLQHLKSHSIQDTENRILKSPEVEDLTSDDMYEKYDSNGNSNISSQLVSEFTQKIYTSIPSSQTHANILKPDTSAIALVKRLIPLLPLKYYQKKKKIGKCNDIDDRFNQKFLKYNADHIDTIDTMETEKIKLSTQRSIRKKSYYIHCLLCDKTIKDNIHSYYQHVYTNYHNTKLTSLESINDECSHCQNNKKMRKANREIQENINLIDEFIILHGKNRVNCLICNCLILNTTNAIRNHMLSKQHKKNHIRARAENEKLFDNVLSFSLDWYNSFKYYSCLHNKKFKSDIDFKADLTKYNSKPKDLSKVCSLHDDDVNQFMSCIYCATVWYGPLSTRVEHSFNKMHLYMMKTRDFLKFELSGGVHFLLKNFEQQASDLVLNADLVQSKEKEKQQLIKCLEDTVKVIYPSVKAHPFGSRISGIGLLDSDIDIFLDCEGNTYDGISTMYRQELHFTSVEKCVRSKPEYWEVEEALPNSRTPIIKLCHRDTEIKCDVSFTNGLSVENTKLLRCFNNKYPLCRRMILFLKKWLSLCGLSGPHNISSYALAWCVIFYLQKEHELFPSIASMIKKQNESHLVAGWETGVSYDFTIKAPNATFKDLLIGFFDYYAKFNYMQNVICPHLADVVLKRSFAHWKSLSDTMQNYVIQLETRAKAEYFSIDSPMCIQDPFNLSYNLTKALQKLTLNKFRKYCEQSADVLRNI